MTSVLQPLIFGSHLFGVLVLLRLKSARADVSGEIPPGSFRTQHSCWFDSGIFCVSVFSAMLGLRWYMLRVSYGGCLDVCFPFFMGRWTRTLRSALAFTAPCIWQSLVSVRSRSTGSPIYLGDDFRICLRIQHFLVRQRIHIHASPRRLREFTHFLRESGRRIFILEVDSVLSPDARGFGKNFPFFLDEGGLALEVDSRPARSLDTHSRVSKRCLLDEFHSFS